MPTVRHAGADLSYRLDGREDGPVLMLSNSLGSTLDMWAPQREALGARFRLLRYDTRGHGASTFDGAPFGIAELGGDALAVLDHAGVDAALFCGLSMGGQAGLWLAAHHPGRFRAMVLANTAALINTPTIWNARIAKVRADGMAATAPAVVERWLSREHARAHPEQAAALEAMVAAVPLATYAASCAAIRDTDLRPLLGDIALPVLVISGRRDNATTAGQARLLAQGIPGAALLELDAAHFSNWERPAEFNRGVIAFLSAYS